MAMRGKGGKLPDFIIIGAMKAGTTTLHGLLKRHPDIFMPAEKEPHFFSYDNRFRRGLSWYAALFDERYRLCGECSPSYAEAPLYPETPARIVTSLPQVKVVYCLRDPISRAVSQYKHVLALGKERRGVDEALRDPLYQHKSFYAHQLDRYLEAGVPLSRMHFVQSEALRRDREAAMEALFGFLGADPALAEVASGRDWHTSESKRVPTARGLVIKERIRPYLKKLPWSVRTHAERALLYPFSGPMPAVSPAPATRAHLQEVFAEDADRLRKMTGLALPGWSV